MSDREVVVISEAEEDELIVRLKQGLHQNKKKVLKVASWNFRGM